MAEGDIKLKFTLEQQLMLKITIKGMKWNVMPDAHRPDVYAGITDDDGADVVKDLILDEAEQVVAAHNAAIDIILEEFE